MDEPAAPATPAAPAATPAAPGPGQRVLAPATPLRTGLGLLLPLLSIVSLLLVLLGGLAGGVRWLLLTEAGSAWLLQRLPLQLDGYKGTLLGPDWQAERLRVSWDEGRAWLQIEGLKAEGLEWQWRPHGHAWVGLRAQSLSARRLTLHSGPPGTTPPTLPATLRPPVQLAVARLQVQEAVIDAQAPLQAVLALDLAFDPRPGASHGLNQWSLQRQGVLVEGQLQLANAQPYMLAARASLRPLLDGDAPAWAAVAAATGPLADLALTATLRGRPQGRAEAPALDLRARLQPLQPWPLAELQLQTQALDLAALAPQAPATRLSGQATLQGGAQGQPLEARLRLDNAQPGRWNERRLPLRQLALHLQGQLDQRDRLDLKTFEMSLADASGPAGQLSGSAVWLGHTLTLATRVDQLNPQRLDGRAAAMTLTGPVDLALTGLPSPAPGAPPPPPPNARWKLDLQGRLDGSPQAVQLQLEGSADDHRLDLRRARAQAGAASAELSATLARAGRGDWTLSSTGTVLDFDPLPWWPGEAGSAWRQGPHRLSGDWKFDVRVPGNAERMPALQLAQRVAGNGRLRVQRSQLAGVPLAADFTLGYTPATPAAPASLQGDLALGGNHLVVDGRGDPAGNGAGDRWRVELNAETLNTLAPLAQLHPALQAWAPRGGSATARLAAEGRWPAMRTEGQAALSQLKTGALDLARGSASWRMDTDGAQPLALKLDLAGLGWTADGGSVTRADNLRLDLRGTLAEHQIDVSGALPLVPPPMLERVLGIQVQSGTRAQMQAQGRWQPNPPAAVAGGAPPAAAGGRWNAVIQRIVVGSWDGSSGTAPPASGWVEARDLRAEFEFDGEGRLLALQAPAGRVQLADAVALRWDEVAIDLRGAEPQLRLRADIEAFALAPLLARAQPNVGWQGDLRLAARVDLRAAERMDADLVFERLDGDLHVAGGEGTQLLGLSELKLAVSAHDGVWNFNPSFRGRSLGELSGQLRVQSTPERRWPQPDAPVSGQLQARVADVGIWGAWLPPGWRLTGALKTTAQVSGPFKNPLLDGELSGTGLGVRNLLQGVNVRDGDVLVKLVGDTAQIERFTLKGGDGGATITGSAQLVGKPSAKLQLKAERFRVLGRVDRMITASGQAQLALGGERTQLDGKFTIDEGLYDASRSDAPSLDDDVTLRRAGEAVDAPAATAAPAPRRSFAMGVDIDLGEQLRIRGRGLETGLRGQLRLTTPGGRLAVHGSINTDGGTYAAYGQKLDIERGIVAFSGAADNPRLDVLALRPKIDQRVGVAITGNLLTPRVRLFAEPELSDSEKLSWLVLGRAPDGLGRNDTALLQRAAVALLSGEGEAPTDALMKSLGIDEVSLRQGDGDVRETVITIGKQLSRRWYLGYERGVNATTGTWQLIYRIAQRFTLRAQSGVESAIDVIWTWRTQETPADAGMRKSTVVPR